MINKSATTALNLGAKNIKISILECLLINQNPCEVSSGSRIFLNSFVYVCFYVFICFFVSRLLAKPKTIQT